MLLPLLVPVVIAGASGDRAAARAGRQQADDLGRWLPLLSLYDAVFVLLSVAVFDFLLED